MSMPYSSWPSVKVTTSSRLEVAGAAAPRCCGGVMISAIWIPSAELLHDANELLPVLRIGGVAGLLQAVRGLGRCVGGQHAGVARVARDEPGVVGEGLVVGG